MAIKAVVVSADIQLVVMSPCVGLENKWQQLCLAETLTVLPLPGWRSRRGHRAA